MSLRPAVFVVGNFVQACCWTVPRLPSPGETLAATALSVEAGGKGLNVAVGLQRLGADVHALIGIGSDAAGDGLLALFQSEGMEARYVTRFEGASGWGAGLIGSDGQNAIAVFPGPNLALTADHVDLAVEDIVRSRLVYAQFETALPAVVRAFQLAFAANVPTVLNPSPWQPVPDALLVTTSVVLVNEVEVCGLLNLASPLPLARDEALLCIRMALPAFWVTWTAAVGLVVTLGAQGCLAFERPDGMAEGGPLPAQSSVGWLAATCDVSAVDTVGAGDAFASGFCAAWLAGLPMPERLRWGNACGSWVAGRSGVLAHLPRIGMMQAWWAEGRVPPPAVMRLG